MSPDTTNNQREKLYSALITTIFMGAVLLFLYWYKFVVIQEQQPTPVSAMLINFGDNQNGSGAQEPAPQEGGLSSAVTTSPESAAAEAAPEKTVTKISTPEKEITGSSERNKTKLSEKDLSQARKSSSATPKKSTGTSNSTVKNTTKSGNSDGQGNAAVGNLVRGRGTAGNSQGTGTGKGNAGDPLGGAGDGDSKIGIDRKLTGYIPGTMGRGGSQPSHSCTATGSISISYTVNSAGQVISARRASGIADPCVVSTATSWVRQYVKAERAPVSSTGTYNIKF